MLAYLYKELGKEDEALTILNNSHESLENQFPEEKDWGVLINLASIHAIREEKEKALRYLSDAVERELQWGWHDFIEIHPIFELLWDDPKYKAIVKRAQDEKAAIRTQVQEMIESGEIDL